MNGSKAQSSALAGTESIAYTVPQAAQLLNIGVRTAWTHVHAGRIKSFKIGNSRRVSRRAIDEYITQQEDAETGTAR